MLVSVLCVRFGKYKKSIRKSVQAEGGHAAGCN